LAGLHELAGNKAARDGRGGLYQPSIDLGEDPSLPRGRQRGKDRQFPAPREAGCRGRQGIFRRAFARQGRLPHKVTLDGYQASHGAAKEVLGEHPQCKRSKLRSSKYLNNLIGQDHRSIKGRLGPMLGFKHFTESRNDDCRHRTHASDQEESVQTRQAGAVAEVVGI